jgi:hypothetical protein
MKKVVEIISLNDRFGPNKGTPTLFKCLKSFAKKLRLLCGGALDVKGVNLICHYSQLGGGKFLSVNRSFDPIYYSQIFLIRIAAARIKLCPCSYFTVAKNPRDFSSYALHQLCLAGCCEQGAVPYLYGQSLSVH